MPLKREERAFLRTFKASFDIGVLFVFADWLDEQGDERAAAFRKKLNSARNGIESWRWRVGMRRPRGRPIHEKVAAWIAALYRYVRTTFAPGWKNMDRKQFTRKCMAAGAAIVRRWREWHDMKQTTFIPSIQ